MAGFSESSFPLYRLFFLPEATQRCPSCLLSSNSSTPSAKDLPSNAPLPQIKGQQSPSSSPSPDHVHRSLSHQNHLVPARQSSLPLCPPGENSLTLFTAGTSTPCTGQANSRRSVSAYAEWANLSAAGGIVGCHSRDTMSVAAVSLHECPPSLSTEGL